MTSVIPSERVADLLLANRYRRLSQPLEIAGLDFDVAGAFVGEDGSADLVVVVDTAADGERKVVQQVEGIARALDVVRSKRSLTTVVVGPRPVGRSFESLSQVSRVLAVDEASDAAELRDRLAVLLPLVLPDHQSLGQGLGEDEEIQLPSDPIAAELFDASRIGEDAVRDKLHGALRAVLEPEEDDGS